jgi:trimethylamine--corrinoid protein Co-methyltransferase
MNDERPVRRGRGGREAPVRQVDYHTLRNPFRPQEVYSADQIAAIHANALRVLEELGMRVLLPEARARFRAAGALVDEDSGMVRIGREIVAAALATAPRSVTLKAAVPEKDLVLEPGRLVFVSGAGCPNCTDRVRGRRPGRLADLTEILHLTDGFDAVQMLNAAVEPQDVPAPLRHYATMRLQLRDCRKLPFVYARGTAQVEESFQMIRLWRGLSEAEFAAASWTKTVINTNSPRQLDIPMAQGIIDFARWNQCLIITPFCMLGAMAPVTVPGALTLQHAEALAGIALAQIVRPGAPVLYGNFASNVDMRSGAPAFGTPEHLRATLGSGQLARHIGLPWRSAAGTAANSADAQGAHETELSFWAAVLAGATMIIHAAGWLEGGLAFGYEKFVTDMEMLQVMAEMCAAPAWDDGELAFEALSEVPPGGHFFGAGHTLARYATAFYPPLVADTSNHGQWVEAGRQTAEERATAVWQSRLAAWRAPALDPARAEALDAFIARAAEAGGAPPVS